MNVTPLSEGTTLPEAAGESAPLKRRFGAMLYEGVLLFGVSFIAGYLFDTLTQSRHALMYRHTREIWLFLVYGGYFVYFWTHSGQTLAMKTWHIQLTWRGADAVPLGIALLRYCACWVIPMTVLGLVKLAGLSAPLEFAALAAALLLPPCLMLVLPSRQFIYDQLIGTRLVNARRLEVGKTPGTTTA